MPAMKIDNIGYGAGQRDLPIPNPLRVLLGMLINAYEEDVVSLVQTNIDDMNPEFYEHIADRLFNEGALDVFLIPIQMKKTRPATMLSVITDEEKMEKVVELIFPSYEECRKIATCLDIPLKNISQEAEQDAFDLLAKKRKLN